MVRKYRGSELLMAVIMVIMLCIMALIGRSAVINAAESKALEEELSVAYAENNNLMQANQVLYQNNEQMRKELSEMDTMNNNLRQQLVAHCDYTSDELMLAVRVVIAECGSEPTKGQMAVAQCIRDRLREGSYGSSLTEVLTHEGQFAKPYEGNIWNYEDAVLSTLRVLVLGESVFDEPVFYFYNAKTANPRAVDWFQTLPLIDVIGNHTFRGK